MTLRPDDTVKKYGSHQVALILGVSRYSLSYLCRRADVRPETGPAKQPNTLANYYSLEDMAKLKAAIRRKRKPKPVE